MTHKRAGALVHLVIALCAVLCAAASSRASSPFYVRSPFGSASCLNGDTGSIPFTDSHWAIIADMKYPNDPRQNVYCMRDSKTLQFLNGHSTVVEPVSFGILRYLPALPRGLAFSTLTIVNVSRVDARKQAGCAVNPDEQPAGIAVEFGVRFTTGDRRSVRFIYQPLWESITETPGSLEVDVDRALHIPDEIRGAAVAYVTIWNTEFPGACTAPDPDGAGMRVFSDIVEFEALVVTAEQADV